MTPLFACTLCHSGLGEELRRAITGPHFWVQFAGLALTMAVLVLILMMLARQWRWADARVAGVSIGMGLGGFLDGVVFHQLLQLHGTVSARVPLTTLLGAKVNMFWDGVFHAGVWALTLLGVILLHRSAAHVPRVHGRAFTGAMITGWGAFNLVEGLIDHHLLDLHDVHQAGAPYWNYAFLFLGLILVLCGWLGLLKPRLPK